MTFHKDTEVGYFMKPFNGNDFTEASKVNLFHFRGKEVKVSFPYKSEERPVLPDNIIYYLSSFGLLLILPVHLPLNLGKPTWGSSRVTNPKKIDKNTKK